ncbi:hypothetical protein ACVWWJ_001496 [Luteibacter sp. HA06]
MLRVLMALAAAWSCIAVAEGATVVPTVYEAGHFYATPTTRDGKSLRILFDTGAGGSNYFITRDAAARLKLKASSCTAAPRNADSQDTFVARPDYVAGAALPKATNHCGDVLAIAKPPGFDNADGIAGGRYLEGRTWTFDYPAHQLRVEDDHWRPSLAAHPMDLGMQRNAAGGLVSAYPRVTIDVGGESIDVLLDTGATAQPTQTGQAAMKTPTVNGLGVASYITSSIMSRWHAAHPEWPVVDAADDALGKGKATRAIQVPGVVIAGWLVGPVWFTERADSNFESFMSEYMDRTVHGAVGANVLDAFVMTLDYRKTKAWLACPADCRARPVK